MTDYTFIGVDMAKEKFDAVILTEEKKQPHRIFENDLSGFKAFIAWLAEHHAAASWVCMEATGHYSELLADYLHQQNILVSIVNPMQIKQFAKLRLSRNKNDKLDAKLIAQYAAKETPRRFTPRSKGQKTLRDYIQLLDTLKCQAVRLKNQVASIQITCVKKEMEKIIQANEKRMKSIEKKIKKVIDKDEEFSQLVKQLISIDGIGQLSAYRLLAYLPAIELFENAKQLAAFMGLCPRQIESGKYKGKSHLTRFGHPALKKTLYMPALSVKRQNKAFKPFIQRLENNGLAPKAIVGALMRKLAHIIFAVLKHGTFFEPKLACKKA